MAGPWEQFQSTDQGPWTQFAPTPPKPSKERTTTEALKDIAAGVVSGAGSLVQLPGQLYGLATGDFSETGALGLGKDIAKYGEEMKSAGLKAREAERAQKIKSAEEKGQWEAFKTAFGETVKDPALLTSFLAEQAPQLLVPFGAAKVAQVGTAAKAAAAAQGLTGTAAEKAVEAVTKAAAERGTRAAIGAGAVQQGSDVGAQAYEDIYKELIRKGATEPDAAQGAINLARAAGASGAIVSLLAQRLPGARSLEESFAGVPGTGGRLLGAVKGALGEGVSEVVEETGGKFGANLAMREVAPETSLTAGLGETAGMAAIGGVGMGGVSGLARRPARPEVAPAPEAPRTGPLTPEEQAELDRQRALSQRPKTTEELLAGIQTGRPTTAEDIARIRDEHETAVIEGLLAQDAEMKQANEVAAKQREQQRQQTQLESEAEAIAGGISDIDTRVREGRIFSRVQDLIDRNIPYASTAINDINQKFGVINEAPLTEDERARVENIMGMVNTFTNFVNLPVLAPKPVDQFAENQAMEALIKERTERGQAEPLRTAPVAPSPRIEEAPISQGVSEGTTLRPTSGVEPSVAEDRQLVTPAPVASAAPPAPFAAPGGFVSSVTLSPAYEGIEPLSVEDADFELEVLQNSAEKGRLTPEQFAGSEIGKRLDTAQLSFVNEGLRADPVGTITALRDRLKQANAAPPAPPVEPASVVEAAATPAPPVETPAETPAETPGSIVPESKTATGQQAGWVLRNKETGEVVMETNDPAKVKALNTDKYEAVPIAQYLASLSKPQKPAAPKAEAPAVEAPTQDRKSLGSAQAQQSNFEQTLRTLLNKFGLKDVGLSIIEGMQDAGSYAQQLIRIADRADNPIRTLRHEAIHALRELGFFTDAQWKSLSKMAKDKWIDQYLKQRNVDGKPLKAGEESRYDAYMREYNGDMEKIIEEAVADAFADFDATKPPAGMLQALLKRMKDLFQSIKSALTKIESPEQIFGKVEEGKLKPGEKREGGERKSVGAEAPKFKEDLGSPSWLQEQIDYAKERGRDRWGVPYMGKTTGSFKGDISVPMSVLEKLRGQRGEQQAVREESLDYIRKNWDEVSKEPPYIEVAYNGEAWISEGNHRIMVAKEKGLDSLPVEIKYFDGGQKVDGPLKPEKLLDIRKSIGGVKAAAQKALQKQPMPEKGLSHVSKDLTNLAQPIFFPQNKTILDRIDSMKDRFWQRLAQGTADQFRTIKEYSPLGYMQARLSKSIDGSLEGLLFHGQVFDDGGALNIKKNTKGMMDILKPIGAELDSYLMWVALNRESRLPIEKRSNIPNMDKLVAGRAEFASGELNGKPRVEVYQDVLRQMNQLNKSVLDVALAKGLIDQKGYDTFSNDIYYIPFYKKMEEDGTVEGAKTASGLTSQQFSKELKGSEAPFGDLMENIVRNWSHILSASMKNAAAQTTLNDAMELQAAEPNLKAGYEWKDGKVYSTNNDKPIAAKFDEDGKQLYAEGELRPELTTNAAGMAKIMVNGQPMYFKVTDELLMDSISSMGYMGPKSKFTLLMRDFKNMLQFGVTASPIFKVNNLIRDSVSALAVSDLKKSPVYNVMTGISLSKKDSPTYISALAGGAIFNFGSAYEGDQAKLIKRLLDQGVDGETILDSPDKIKKALKKTWEAYQELGNRSEAANRLSLYQQMRDKGLSHLQASFMARDLLDFSMQGSWETFRFLTQVVPFMNARIQGLYKLGRDGINPFARVLYNVTTGKENTANDKIRAAQFSVVTAAVGIASALLYLSFKDDEDFKKRDAWDRDNFWWFKIPSLDIAFRIPKPFEVGAFGTLVERTLEQIVDEGAEGKQFGDSLWKTLWDTFSLNPTPQIFKPLVDIYANKDSFSGAPIESAGLERLSKQERKTDTTSPLGIALGGVSTLFPEKFQVSPVQMDYAIKGYFGWLGAMASLSSTYAVMPFKEGEYPDARWLDRASLGLVRDLPAPQSAYVTAFYNSSKEISQAFADMRHYREMGDAEKVQELLEEKGDKIALAKFYDKTAKNIANVRKQIQLITNDKNLDGAEKKEAIERMKLIMSDLAKQAEEVRKSMKP